MSDDPDYLQHPMVKAMHALAGTLVESLPEHWQRGQCLITENAEGSLEYKMTSTDQPEESPSPSEELRQAAEAMLPFWPDGFPGLLVEAKLQETGSWKTGVEILKRE